MRTSIRQRLMFCFAAAAALTLALCSGCSDENIGGAFMERSIKNTPQYKLTVKISPSDDCGSVSLSPEKPNSTYLSGTIVYLTADENSGYRFDHWEGASAQNGASATVAMDGNKAVTAMFAAVKYTVTLSNVGDGATGSGEYAAGATVIITAGSAPAGQRFKNWTTASGGVTFADANSAATTFIMPSNAVTVSANFEAIPAGKYAVTVSSIGTGVLGNGDYTSGATVNIFAGTAPTGQQFKNWTLSSGSGVSFADEKSASTWFTMPSNAVTVTANFETATLTPPVTPTKYSVTVSSAGTNHSGTGSYEAGATVSIYAGAAASGQRFKNWTAPANSGVSFYDANSEYTTFTMPAKAVTVTANFESVYTVTVTGGTGGGSYAANETVTITAGTPPAGQQFKNWTTTTTGVTIANPNNQITTFTMPARAVTVTANFEPIPPTTYAVTVSSNGTGATGTGNYAANAKVNISAGTPPSGQKFKNWTSADGVVFDNANSAATTFTMPAKAVTVTAVFDKSTFTDIRDGKTYKTVKIGSQTWMAENMNYATSSGSWCYDCGKYGRLYDWDAAMEACPTGWHLSTHEDWDDLAASVGGTKSSGYEFHLWLNVGKKLKEASDWGSDNSYNGTDDFGFLALPGGLRENGDNNLSLFYTVGFEGYWWTATEYDNDGAYTCHIHSGSDDMGEFYGVKAAGYSVRCVQDD